jgi:hypothetical protein
MEAVKRGVPSAIVLPSDIPPQWRMIAEMPKELLEWPRWPEVEPPPTGPRVITRRDRLHTAAGETVSMVIALGQQGGAGLEAVRLRLIAWPFRKEYDVTATLEVEGGRSFLTIARVDGWPPDPHVNGLARRHAALRHLPAIVEGHHVHRFLDNARLGREAFAPMGNLPVAAPLDDDLQSFRDFARIVEREFRIDGLSKLTPPDWQRLV